MARSRCQRLIKIPKGPNSDASPPSRALCSAKCHWELLHCTHHNPTSLPALAPMGRAFSRPKRPRLHARACGPCVGCFRQGANALVATPATARPGIACHEGRAQRVDPVGRVSERPYAVHVFRWLPKSDAENCPVCRMSCLAIPRPKFSGEDVPRQGTAGCASDRAAFIHWYLEGNIKLGLSQVVLNPTYTVSCHFLPFWSHIIEGHGMTWYEMVHNSYMWVQAKL